MSSGEDKCLTVRLSDYFHFIHGMHGIKIILQARHPMACPQPIEMVFKQPLFIKKCKVTQKLNILPGQGVAHGTTVQNVDEDR